MKRFREYINEVLNKPVPWQWYNKDKYNYSAKFRVGDASYEVWLDNNTVPYGDNFHQDDWELVFRLSHLVGNPDVSAYGITKTGGELVVFSTVIEIVKAFVREKQPGRIWFTAKEESRKRLYKAFLALVSRQIPGYTGHLNTDPTTPGTYVIEKD